MKDSQSLVFEAEWGRRMCGPFPRRSTRNDAFESQLWPPVLTENNSLVMEGRNEGFRVIKHLSPGPRRRARRVRTPVRALGGAIGGDLPRESLFPLASKKKEKRKVCKHGRFRMMKKEELTTRFGLQPLSNTQPSPRTRADSETKRSITDSTDIPSGEEVGGCMVARAEGLRV